MSKEQHIFEISENFFSLEGEGPHTGHPTVYIRFARCNLKCPLFNNHNRLVGKDGYAELGFDPADYASIRDMPIISKGCDSQYSVNAKFSHMWSAMSTDDLVEDALNTTPFKSWIAPTGLPVILSLTGGEPTLQQKWWGEILFHNRTRDLKHVLVETNSTVPLRDETLRLIAGWLKQDTQRKWTWANSPKLANSGHSIKQTFRPTVAISQQMLVDMFPHQVEQYFKFVVGARDADFDNVRERVAMYHEAGIRKSIPVWLMPEACTTEQQNDIAAAVANKCRDEGFLFSYRLQNALWKNQVGT